MLMELFTTAIIFELMNEPFICSVSLLKSSDWSIIKVDKHRFKKSPKLGEKFVVTGSRISQSLNTEVWELEMTNPYNEIIFNSALLTIGTQLPSPQPLNHEGSWHSTSETYRLYRDEFDLHLQGRLPLRNVMNAFERSRSDGLGGPDALHRLQVDHGLLFVVSGVNDAALIHNDSVICRPGSSVTVTSCMQMKRRGIIRFLHTMWIDDSCGVRQRVAQAVVVLMTLDASTRKPISTLPDWLKDTLGKAGM